MPSAESKGVSLEAPPPSSTRGDSRIMLIEAHTVRKIFKSLFVFFWEKLLALYKIKPPCYGPTHLYDN